MLPVIAIVGRPNVGKSTLFNVLTGTRDALVADLPGLTRDRQYGYGRRGGRYIVVDTGGLVVAPSGIETLMAAQTAHAVAEADRVLFVVDARSGPTPEDLHVADRLRRTGKPVIVAANKSEGKDADVATAEFHAFGLGPPVAISSAHGEGLDALVEQMLSGLEVVEEAAPESEPDAIRIAVVGRPNVGKSTLINRLIGEERLVAFDEPGTTRDSVHVPFERDGHRYVLIDTAGVRRRARVEDAVEKFSVIKALQAIDDAHVVIGVLDAHETVAEQDATLLGHVAERGRALILAVNKWDHIPPEQRDHIKNQLALKVPFLDFAPQHFISALHGTGVGDLLGAARRGGRAPRHAGAPPGRKRRPRARPPAAPRPRRAQGAADSGADARAREGARGASAAAGQGPAHQAALRSPGRAQPAADRGARQPGGARAGGLPALPDQHLPRGVPARRHAGARRVPCRQQPVCRPAKRAQRAAEAEAPPADPAQEGPLSPLRAPPR